MLQDDAPMRKRIITALKRQGGMTVAELADEFSITPMGVRHHLMALDAQGLVQRGIIRRGRGRPSVLWTLTPKAQDEFPCGETQLLLELLHIVAERQGPDAVEQLFSARADRLIAEHRAELKGLDLPQRVEQVAEILDRRGAMAEWRASPEYFVITEHNCVLSNVAREFPAICDHELRWIRAMLDANVHRVEHQAAGAPACVFHVRRTD